MLRRTAQALTGAATAATAVQMTRFTTMERSEYHTTRSALEQFVAFDVLRLVSWRARRQHDADCEAFGSIQASLLRERLEANKDTAFGRAHGYASLLSEPDIVEAFRQRLPVTTGADYAPWVARVAAGEPSVLNAEPETQLAATSGTSGSRTLLPNTPTMSRTFFIKGILVIFDTMARVVPGVFQMQRTCKLAFAPSWSTTEGGLKVGPNSSNPLSNKRLLTLYSTPEAGYTIQDEQAALYVHALFAARDRKLGIIEANFVSQPARLLALLSRDGERIAADVATGKLDATVAARLPAATVASLEGALGGADAARADEIRAALRGPAQGASDSQEGAPPQGLARRLWPELQLILANATGAFAPYAERLRAGPAAGVPILSTVLAASEGLIGVALEPTPDGDATYCLVPRAMLFEFVPHESAPRHARDEAPQRMRAEAAARAAAAAAQQQQQQQQQQQGGGGGGTAQQPRTLLAHELEVGREYELVVTNLGGLARYRIGDVVRVRGFHRAAPVVEFRYRVGQLLNLRGEKTSEAALADAVAAALPADAVAEYTAAELAPDDAASPRYLVLVEPAAGAALPPDASARLDAALRDANPVYDTWRRKGAIAPCECRAVPPGRFDALRRRRIDAEGASPQQLKVSRVVRSAEHLALLTRPA